jgi:hypothetical protein
MFATRFTGTDPVDLAGWCNIHSSDWSQGLRSCHDFGLMTNDRDYRQYYDDEAYLLAVGKTFRQTGKINAADFYML